MDQNILERVKCMSNIELSVIIVGYNSWEYISRCVQSFREHSPSISYEIIVVNNNPDNSAPDTFNKQYPEVNIIDNKGNFGFSNGCNLGSKKSLGRFLLFLNPDTELTEDKAIDEMHSLLSARKDIGISSCRTVQPNGKVEREILFSSPWLLIPSFRILYKLFLRKKIQKKFKEDQDIWFPEWVSGSVVMIKRTLFDEIHGWNQDRFWMYHEDPDICNRIRYKGKKIAIIRNKTINHIGGGTSRKNIETTVKSKTEVLISAHNYIQLYSYGIRRPLIHALFSILTILDMLLKSVTTLALLNGGKFKIYIFTTGNLIAYYSKAIQRKTWKSTKILNYANLYK